MNKNISKLIEIAYAMKPLQQDFRAWHLAGIFKKNRLVSLGTNVKKTHPFALKNGYPWASEAIHAECLAVIRGRLEDYSGHNLIVLRLDNNGNLAMSKPCKYCSNLLTKMNFSEIIYSDMNGKFVSYEN